MNVSAVLVTRGNVDMGPILDTLPFDDIVIWDNSRRHDDLGLYGRYAGIAEAKHDIIYVQDDDLLFTRHAELLAHYEPGRLTVNFEQPHDIPWPSRGAVFHRDLPARIFSLYDQVFPRDRWFTHYGCDGILCLLADTIVVDLGHLNLPHAFDTGRISTSPGWYDDKRLLVRERAGAVLESFTVADRRPR